MPKFIVNYSTENGEVSQKTEITSKDYLTAVAEFVEAQPSDEKFIEVHSRFGGFQQVPNPNWNGKTVNSEKEQAEREQAEAERLAEVELLKKIIIAADTPLQLSFTQLELLLENFSQFPTLEKGDEEIYSLREKLYMLSFWNTALQSSLQTRLLSQIASVTSAPQTGNSGGGQPKWAPLAAMAAVSKLGNIETDVDDMADGFLGED
ncbi:hypothetical protein N9Z32_07690 [Akkermansiaceae bacterium]|nr:hypothetical protein [Akkermansiaceae bacterium]MDB4755582.1 hypothetical protein [Akkermansiaceae bacterium]